MWDFLFQVTLFVALLAFDAKRVRSPEWCPIADHSRFLVVSANEDDGSTDTADDLLSREGNNSLQEGRSITDEMETIAEDIPSSSESESEYPNAAKGVLPSRATRSRTRMCRLVVEAAASKTTALGTVRTGRQCFLLCYIISFSISIIIL